MNPATLVNGSELFRRLILVAAFGLLSLAGIALVQSKLGVNHATQGAEAQMLLERVVKAEAYAKKRGGYTFDLQRLERIDNRAGASPSFEHLWRRHRLAVTLTKYGYNLTVGADRTKSAPARRYRMRNGQGTERCDGGSEYACPASAAP